MVIRLCRHLALTGRHSVVIGNNNKKKTPLRLCALAPFCRYTIAPMKIFSIIMRILKNSYFCKEPLK
jgi:hypothetical protein